MPNITPTGPPGRELEPHGQDGLILVQFKARVFVDLTALEERTSDGISYALSWITDLKPLDELKPDDERTWRALDRVVGVFKRNPDWTPGPEMMHPPASKLETMTDQGERAELLAQSLEDREKLVHRLSSSIFTLAGIKKLPPLLIKIECNYVDASGIRAEAYLDNRGKNGNGPLITIGHVHFSVEGDALLIREVQLGQGIQNSNWKRHADRMKLSMMPEEEKISESDKLNAGLMRGVRYQLQKMRNFVKPGRNLSAYKVMNDVSPRSSGTEEILISAVREMVLTTGMIDRQTPVDIIKAEDNYWGRAGIDALRNKALARSYKIAPAEIQAALEKYLPEDLESTDDEWVGHYLSTALNDEEGFPLLIKFLLERIPQELRPSVKELKSWGSQDSRTILAHLTQRTIEYQQAFYPYRSVFKDLTPSPDSPPYARRIPGHSIDELPFEGTLHITPVVLEDPDLGVPILGEHLLDNSPGEGRGGGGNDGSIVGREKLEPAGSSIHLIYGSHLDETDAQTLSYDESLLREGLSRGKVVYVCENAKMDTYMSIKFRSHLLKGMSVMDAYNLADNETQSGVENGLTEAELHGAALILKDNQPFLAAELDMLDRIRGESGENSGRLIIDFETMSNKDLIRTLNLQSGFVKAIEAMVNSVSHGDWNQAENEFRIAVRQKATLNRDREARLASQIRLLTVKHPDAAGFIVRLGTAHSETFGRYLELEGLNASNKKMFEGLALDLMPPVLEKIVEVHQAMMGKVSLTKAINAIGRHEWQKALIGQILWGEMLGRDKTLANRSAELIRAVRQIMSERFATQENIEIFIGQTTTSEGGAVFNALTDRIREIIEQNRADDQNDTLPPNIPTPPTKPSGGSGSGSTGSPDRSGPSGSTPGSGPSREGYEGNEGFVWEFRGGTDAVEAVLDVKTLVSVAVEKGFDTAPDSNQTQTATNPLAEWAETTLTHPELVGGNIELIGKAVGIMTRRPAAQAVTSILQNFPPKLYPENVTLQALAEYARQFIGTATITEHPHVNLLNQTHTKADAFQILGNVTATADELNSALRVLGDHPNRDVLHAQSRRILYAQKEAVNTQGVDPEIVRQLVKAARENAETVLKRMTSEVQAQTGVSLGEFPVELQRQIANFIIKAWETGKERLPGKKEELVDSLAETALAIREHLQNAGLQLSEVTDEMMVKASAALDNAYLWETQHADGQIEALKTAGRIAGVGAGATIAIPILATGLALRGAGTVVKTVGGVGVKIVQNPLGRTVAAGIFVGTVGSATLPIWLPIAITVGTGAVVAAGFTAVGFGAAALHGAGETKREYGRRTEELNYAHKNLSDAQSRLNIPPGASGLVTLGIIGAAKGVRTGLSLATGGRVNNHTRGEQAVSRAQQEVETAESRLRDLSDRQTDRPGLLERLVTPRNIRGQIADQMADSERARLSARAGYGGLSEWREVTGNAKESHRQARQAERASILQTQLSGLQYWSGRLGKMGPRELEVLNKQTQELAARAQRQSDQSREKGGTNPEADDIGLQAAGIRSQIQEEISRRTEVQRQLQERISQRQQTVERRSTAWRKANDLQSAAWKKEADQRRQEIKARKTARRNGKDQIVVPPDSHLPADYNGESTGHNLGESGNSYPPRQRARPTQAVNPAPKQPKKRETDLYNPIEPRVISRPVNTGRTGPIYTAPKPLTKATPDSQRVIELPNLHNHQPSSSLPNPIPEPVVVKGLGRAELQTAYLQWTQRGEEATNIPGFKGELPGSLVRVGEAIRAAVESKSEPDEHTTGTIRAFLARNSQ